MALLADRALDEVEKEQRIRAASVSLLVDCMSILARAAAALAIALLPLAVLGATNLVRFSEVFAWIATLPGIALSTSAMVVTYVARTLLTKQPYTTPSG